MNNDDLTTDGRMNANRQNDYRMNDYPTLPVPSDRGPAEFQDV
ncbi:MAG: hypothetical protein WB421_07300 [Terriglobales bacterium]